MTDNKELESKINYISNINMVTEFITFRLGYNTKNPMNPNSQWGKTQRHKWAPRTLEDLEKEDINHGMPCGKINGFWVLDIDNYKDKETCQFTSNFGDIAEYLEVDLPRIGGGPGNYHFRFVLFSQSLYRVVVKPSRCRVNFILYRSIDLAGKTYFPAVGQMSAVRKREAHYGIAGFYEC